MRRRYFIWTYLVITIILTIYGGYSIFYGLSKDRIPILGLIFFIIGIVLLIIFVVLAIITYFQRKKERNQKEIEIKEIEKEEAPVIKNEEVSVNEEPNKKEENVVVNNNPTSYTKQVDRSENTYASRYDVETIFVGEVGRGLILRVTGGEIFDMRTNTYYGIENNIVKQKGSGPLFEISGNRIRSAFGSYLYELSGDSVNKVFGGYYASFSGNRLTIHDLSKIYEFSGSLSQKQKLAVVALLFGS